MARDECFDVQGVLFTKTLVCKCLSTKTLVDTFWLTTQGVNIISAAYAQSIQSIIKALYNLLTYKSLLKACIRQPLIISEPL